MTPSVSPSWHRASDRVPLEGRGDWQQMLESLGELYVRGVDVDWAGFDKDHDHARRKVVRRPIHSSVSATGWMQRT